MLFTNLKIFWKFLGRNRVYTAVTVVGFSVSLMFVIVLVMYVRQELSVDKFHEKKDRIYMAVNNIVGEKRGSYFGNPAGPWMAENYPDVESYVRAASWEGEIDLPGGEVIDAAGMLADSIFFNVFSFPLLKGDPSEVLARPASMVLSQSMAGRLFDSEDPMGKSVKYADIDFTVTGVFADFPVNTIFEAPDLVIDYGRLNQLRGDNTLNSYNNSGWTLFVVERPGGNVHAYCDDMVAKFKEFWWAFQEGFGTYVDFVPLEDVHFGEIGSETNLRSNSLTGVMLYLGIALLILVVALLNYVNMTVAQAGFRAREVALKKLHGSSRGMIISQLLIESLTMTVISFVVGLVLAFVLESFFDDVLNTTLGLASAFTLPVIAAIVGLIVVLAVISGIVPALMMSRFKPLEIIKGSFSRRVKGIYSKVLAVFQYAVSIVLLVCSAMIVLQSRYLATRDVGLDRDGVMLIMINGVDGMTDIPRQQAAKELLANIPGVEAVSRLGRNPFNSWGGNWSFSFEGEPLSFERFEVDSTFFRLFGVTIEPTGVDPKAGNAIYLNRMGYNALRVAENDNTVRINENAVFPVVGILSDFNFRPLHEAQGSMMLSINEDNLWAGALAVKISAGSDLVATSKRVTDEFARFAGTDRFEWEWADDTVRGFYEAERRTSRIMGAFTALVMLIMFMGIFAMSIYVLRQKEKEIAVRKVNGSTIGEILALLSRQSVVSVAIAFVIACPVAWWAMTRWLESFPYRIGIAWWVFAAAGAAVLALSFICIGWQSYRAASANPVKALMSE